MDKLKKYCLSLVKFSQNELDIIDEYFSPVSVKKKKYLLEEGKICDFIAFITKGSIRHFHIKNGDEITCDISLENTFITEFNSFNKNVLSNISFQALEDTELLVVRKIKLFELYKRNVKFENLGRLIAEDVAIRNTKIAMSLASDKPEIRYKNLLTDKPEIFQRVPQKYIANILGITPESLSRIRKRIYTNLKS